MSFMDNPLELRPLSYRKEEALYVWHRRMWIFWALFGGHLKNAWDSSFSPLKNPHTCCLWGNDFFLFIQFTHLWPCCSSTNRVLNTDERNVFCLHQRDKEIRYQSFFEKNITVKSSLKSLHGHDKGIELLKTSKNYKGR